MTHYDFYSVEDFVQDNRFRAWVRCPSPEEDVAWHEWIQDNPEKLAITAEARAIVLSIQPIEDEPISDAEIENDIQGILANLPSDEVSEPEFARTRRFPVWLKAAASVAVVACAAVWYISRDRLTRTISPDESVTSDAGYEIERVNRSDKPLLINLPDGSSVLLEQNSLVRYSKQFAGNTRRVVLVGGAFFEVAKDSTKPFYVYADRIVAKVLGTSFEITTNTTDKQVRVTVKTGSVSVYSDPKNTEATDGQPNVILTKNEQFVYRSDVSQVQHIRLDSASVEKMSIPDTYMDFNDTNVTQVFKSLKAVYGVEFDYENEKIGACSITASFTDEPFILRLDLMCRSIGLQYKIINDRVTIRGSGCLGK
jgi:ferric-dicitrate binding protein FerR (iron transport regulator)